MNNQILSRDEQEALVQVIIHKIPAIKEVERLKELVHQALELLLHQAEDNQLRQTLIKCVEDIFAGIEFVPPSSARTARLKRAVRDCVEVLQAAKEHRLPLDIEYPMADVVEPSANDNRHPKGHAHKRAAVHHPVNVKSVVWVGSVLALVMAGVIGSVVWKNLHTDQSSAFEEAKALTEQIFAVAGGQDETTNYFGGHVKRRMVEGRVNVVTDKVPSRICAASGWELVHKGTLTIDGVTPRRVSSAIITDLCYGNGEEVTMSWEPKDPNFHPAPAARQ